MNQYNSHSPSSFISWLQAIIDRINELERLGREAVAKHEQDIYIALMRQKAEVLASLEEEAQPYLAELDNDDALDFAERSLSVYSFNATKALELNSVFYMSALLFPTDHKAGDPNNLELFKDELKKRLGFCN